MLYKCIRKDKDETWLTVGKEYRGEAVVSGEMFFGGTHVLIYKADDGYRCYALRSNFEQTDKQGDTLGV
jgi:hypothetical protein